MNRIEHLFAEKKTGKVLNIFLTAGFPHLEDTVSLVKGFEEAGADLIELGMPFSDPLADGPTIQKSSELAIENGATIGWILETVKEIRTLSNIPLVLMGYLNPVLKYGLSRFVEEANQAGVDGLIIPDVPLEESERILELLKGTNISFIHLVSPTTSDERMRRIDDISSGFVYCVSVTGVTGSRDGESVAKSVDSYIDRVKTNITKNPVLVGFGIKNREDAVVISKKTDGFIVGSAVIELIMKNFNEVGWKEKVFSFVHSLKL